VTKPGNDGFTKPTKHQAMKLDDNYTSSHNYKKVSKWFSWETNENDNNRRKNKDYEKVNYISDNGDSIYAAPIEDLPGGGQAYYSLNVIREIIKEELDRRLGPSLNKNENVYE
jgi:hypothetical protein